MALSALDDRKKKPGDAEVTATLGKAGASWREIVGRLQDDHGPLAEEWHYAGDKFGWSLRLKRGDRNLVYLIPGQGRFLVGLVLGAKAVEAARRAKLPRAVMEPIEAAKVYAEGRGVRLEVRTRKDLPAILELVAFKTAR